MSGYVRIAALAAAVGVVVGHGSAWADEPAAPVSPSTQELVDKIDALKQQIDALQVQANRQAASSTVDTVLRDADARSAPMLQATATDFTAGYKGGKFIIQSADGKFSINPNFQLQVRNVTNVRKTGGEDWAGENGFELRRMKFGFAGNVFSKDLTYELLFDIPRTSGNPTLQFAWARYRFAPDWLVRVGQFADPLGKEQTGSSRRLLTAERSLLNEILIGGDNPVQGASLIYAPPERRLRGELAFTDGTNQSNTNFRDTNATAAQTLSPAVPATTVVINGVPTVTSPARPAVVIPGSADTRPEWGTAGRVEFQAIGEKFKGYDDYTALGQADPLLVFGAGADVTQSGNSNLFTYTGDVQFENTRGLGLFGAYVGRLQTEFNTAQQDASDYGFVLQAGQLIGPKFAKAQWELFARYDYTRLDAKRLAGTQENDVHEITVGTNGYFQGHNAKVTLDVTYLPNGAPTGAASNVDSVGAVTTPDDQIIVRAQFQLLI